MSETIRVTADGHVAVIRLHAPDQRNALTPEMAQDLTANVQAASADPQVGAVVLTGDGSCFCSGMNLVHLRDVLADPVSGESFAAIDAVYDTFAALRACEVPVIAAVRGDAVGAGVNLAFAADLRVVASDARFISGFGRLGLHAGGGHFSLLAQAGPPEVAVAMAIGGETLTGQRAFDLGLAWAVSPGEEVEPRAAAIARRAAADPALARRSISTLRATTAPAVTWDLAVRAERAAQIWSQRRAGSGEAV